MTTKSGLARSLSLYRQAPPDEKTRKENEKRKNQKQKKRQAKACRFAFQCPLPLQRFSSSATGRRTEREVGRGP